MESQAPDKLMGRLNDAYLSKRRPTHKITRRTFGYAYSKKRQTNTLVLRKVLASIENGEYGLAFAKWFSFAI